jgi:transketolase
MKKLINQHLHLKNTSIRVREHIIRLTLNGGCFIGSALSCADILVYLYSDYLKISKDNLSDPCRDYVFLSKGHAVPALYSVLAELKFFDIERLNHHLKITDNIPGIEFHSGSLGHGLPLAAGVALDCKMKKQINKVIVIVGDGELNEGSNWEAVLFANAYKLNNLVIIVDRNRLQANMQTEKLIPLEPLENKFEAFGCNVFLIDGHSFDEMDECFNQLPKDNIRPNVVIADTIRGKGLPAIENRIDKWFCNLTEKDAGLLLEELHNVKNNGFVN